ncbi:MAG: thiamine pyrophosphate-dependent enzyme possible carboligase or decarboxylase [Candidatus Taylorbacteria bacterium]|nr:thiamine pyrophosphate-dependent enzyme possible carboligase or decarboxylase [Candidatus Taylorbacteria bacterium]
MKPTKKSCAEIIVDFLVDKKIDRVFDLSGGMIAFMEDAISNRDGIDCFPMHHEQAAGFAAEGYARMNQNFGVAMATSGPGAMNLMTAIGSSYFDSIPTMFIVGQVHAENIKKREHVRQEGFQETDIVSVSKPVSKYAVQVLDPSMLVYELEKSHFIMKSGRSGSVVIDIPINIQRTEVEVASLMHFIGSSEHAEMMKASDRHSVEQVEEKVQQLEELLKNSRAPLAIIGNGVRLSDTADALADFVRRNNLPVVTSLLGVDSFEYGERLVGFIGSNGNREANIAFANADLIIALGTRLDMRQTGDPKFFNPAATVVHVDIDKHSLNYAIKSALTFEMHLTDFFAAAQKIETPEKAAWFSFIRSVRSQFARPFIYSPDKVDPNTFIHELSSAASPAAVVVVDVGQNQMWTAQSWKIKKGQRLLFSGGMGAMGFSLPAAIGAWCAGSGPEIISVCGDGGFQINIQEMETVSRNNIPLKLFILNNNSLGMVREFQDLYFNKNYQSTVVGYGCPDLKKIANAFDFEYLRIEGLDKDDPALKGVLQSKKPVLIEVTIDMLAALQPKIVYGHALDDQAPYLDEAQKKTLEKLKSDLQAS